MYVGIPQGLWNSHSRRYTACNFSAVYKYCITHTHTLLVLKPHKHKLRTLPCENLGLGILFDTGKGFSPFRCLLFATRNEVGGGGGHLGVGERVLFTE